MTWAKEMTPEQLMRFSKQKGMLKNGQTLILISLMNQSNQWDQTKTMELTSSSMKKF